MHSHYIVASWPLCTFGIINWAHAFVHWMSAKDLILFTLDLIFFFLNLCLFLCVVFLNIRNGTLSRQALYAHYASLNLDGGWMTLTSVLFASKALVMIVNVHEQIQVHVAWCDVFAGKWHRSLSRLITGTDTAFLSPACCLLFLCKSHGESISGSFSVAADAIFSLQGMLIYRCMHVQMFLSVKMGIICAGTPSFSS